MRSYINRKSERVYVSKEHLDTALALKLKLQKDNPSNRCSWATHKKLMQKEGFDDSDSTDSYRSMIKSYQQSIGGFEKLESYVSEQNLDTIESYKELVGELTWEKQENQEYLKKIRKAKKDIITKGLLIQEIDKAISNTISDERFKEIMSAIPFSPIDDHDNTRMIVCATDWHIGAKVDVRDNQYNYDIAVRRINQFINEVISIGIRNRVLELDFVYMGDMLEHAYMRNSQAYEIEFPVGEQIVKGAVLIFDMLVRLSEHFKVTYRGFAGNHDRLNGNKNDNIDGDNGMVVVNGFIENLIDRSEKDNILFIPSPTFHTALLDVNGKNILLEHGDLVKKNDEFKQ